MFYYKKGLLAILLKKNEIIKFKNKVLGKFSIIIIITILLIATAWQIRQNVYNLLILQK